MKRFVKPLLIIVAILALIYLGIRYSLNSPDEGGLTPVHLAAQEGDADKLSLMLIVGGKAGARSPDGLGDGIDCLVLSYDALVQCLFHV